VDEGWWDWSAFLKKAMLLVPYAFEKEDAKEKWDGEHAFSMLMGKPSLR
jgi:hypothetical protein